jgi:hypothetical protein
MQLPTLPRSTGRRYRLAQGLAVELMMAGSSRIAQSTSGVAAQCSEVKMREYATKSGIVISYTFKSTKDGEHNRLSAS